MNDWRAHRIIGLTLGEFTWLLTGVLLLAYELWAVAFREGDVLTRAYRANCPRWMLWPVGVGVLMGHLHGPTWGGIIGRWSPILFILVGVAVLARDLFIGDRYPAAWVPVLFAAGVVLGAVSWVGRP